jgi:cell division protein FtsW
MLFIWRGIRIAMNAQDMMGSLIAIGITSLISVETIFNIAVVTSTVPATGMPLPFFSYGGTNLVFLLASIGILLNISKGASAPYDLRLKTDSKAELNEKQNLPTWKAGDY